MFPIFGCPPQKKKKNPFVGSNIRSRKEKEIATYSKNSAMIEFNDQSL
jgi:hypothetical protein